MSAVERISNYLNARAKIRQFDQAYIHWINECADSEAVLQTSDIVELLQQRAELLESLKGLVESYTNPESGEVDRKLSMLDAQKIIESANQ